jgi:hypothetical protein
MFQAKPAYRPRFKQKLDTKVRDAVLDHLKTHDWHDRIAFDPTLKQALVSESGHVFRGDDIDFDQSFRWFLRRLNKLLYGNKSDRVGIPIFPMLEYSSNDRWHFHSLMDRPPGITFAQLEFAVRLCWAKVPFCRSRIGFQRVDENWNCYMVKPSQKMGDYADAFRWTNTNLERCVPITLPICRRLSDLRWRVAQTWEGRRIIDALDPYWIAVSAEELQMAHENRLWNAV